MSNDQIPPALTPAEWAGRRVCNRDIAYFGPDRVPGYVAFDVNEIGVTPYVFPADAIMALANAARDDADPGKITRAMVDALRDCVRWSENPERGYGRTPETEMAARLADALESLFPPEGTDAV